MTSPATVPGPGPHVLVADVDDPRPDEQARHHLERVLRLRPGDPLTVGDGMGRWRPCVLADTGIEPVGEVVEVVRPAPAVTVAFALVKGSRPEWIVQKLTEVGVDVVVPFVADRSVVRWDPSRAVRQLDRLRRVAAAAVQQCRRAWAPTIEDLATFEDLATRPAAVRTDPAGSPPVFDTATGPVVLVGPEGGWSEAERAVLGPAVTLGPHVLRAETAAVVAGTLFVALRGGVVAPATR